LLLWKESCLSRAYVADVHFELLVVDLGGVDLFLEQRALDFVAHGGQVFEQALVFAVELEDVEDRVGFFGREGVAFFEDERCG
jgi:hypothetical protein